MVVMEILNAHAGKVSPQFILWFASEVKSALGHISSWLSWKGRNTHNHQVSFPCIPWFASLRSEEVVIRKAHEALFVHGCHGNKCVQSFGCMHCMVCKFTSFASEEIVIGKSA